MLGVALAVALFFAMNIGASGTAASMGAAFGAGAIKKQRIALLLVGAAVFLGAITGGGQVVQTIGKGIIPPEVLNVAIVIIILASACLTLFFANLLGVPLSTSEVTVGSVVGIGIAYRAIYAGKVLLILGVWLTLPVIAFVIAYLLGKGVNFVESRLEVSSRQHLVHRGLTCLLIGAGCYEAFSAGMNNVANAVGPLVGAGLITSSTGVLWGGVFVALGAFILGGKVLHTNAKKITELSLLQGCIVSLTGGTLVVIASIFGLPVPLTQATTMSILGVGTAKTGFHVWKQGTVKRIMKIWILSPVSSLIVSYTLVQTLVQRNIYTLVVVGSAFIMAIGYMSLLRPGRIRTTGLITSFLYPENPVNRLEKVK